MINRLRSPAVMLVAALAAAALVVPALAAEGDAPVDHPLLDEARREIEEISGEIEEAQADRQDAAASLDVVQGRLDEAERLVNEAAAAVARQELEVAAAAERLAALQAEVDELESRLERRSVERFMATGQGPAGDVLLAVDVRDAVDRSSYLDIVSETDVASLEAASAARLALRGASERFDREAARLRSMQEEQEEVFAAVERLRDQRAEAVEAADGVVADLERLEDDLVDDYDRIAEMIRDGRVLSVAASPPSAEGYGWPACTKLNSRFGYRWGRLHAGIDIDGEIGTPIAAAKDGVVVEASYQGGYGNLVLIDHGDGVVTSYAHQSRMLVSVGEEVVRGQLIGEVGNTGRSTGPHLHFETRVNGTPVDPLQYLPDSC